jgi:DNA-binding GntR family transcriptional regulator
MRLAVRNISPAELEEAETLNEQIATESSPARWAELNSQFHGLLTEAARSPRLYAILSRLRDTAAFYVAVTVRDNKDFLKSAHEEHGLLLDACKRGDEEEAARVTVQHLKSTIHGAAEALRAFGSDATEQA